MDGNEQHPPDAQQKRGKGRWRVILPAFLAVLLILAGLLYSQRTALYGLFTGSHLPSGVAGLITPKVPAGFQAEVFYSGLSAPRMIAFGPQGTLFVAERAANSIVALPDHQHSGKAQQKVVVASGLNDPTSLDFYQGALYVGEASQISRLTLDTSLKASDKQVIVPDLPTGGNHITRTVLIGPDGNLYVSIGSSCNNCKEQNQQRASIQVYQINGSNGRLYAQGLRNAVGMAINPWNKQIWATNNGRDLLGDDTPPETVYALSDGGNYGWPRCHAGDIVDPELGGADGCKGVIAPLLKMQAHSAPLGLTFYNATQFPQRYHGLFIAFHGSWNRSVPTGYKVVFVPLNEQGQVNGSVQDFATGWLQSNGDSTGRPVGLAVGPDGALYVSDDKSGTIYRISHVG